MLPFLWDSEQSQGLVAAAESRPRGCAADVPLHYATDPSEALNYMLVNMS